MKIKYWIAGILVAAGIASAADRAVDYALEDAAYNAVTALRTADVGVQRIAVLPLGNDNDGLSLLLRSELVNWSGKYEFFVRNDAEWNLLLKEIEFGDRRGDVMDASTIQKFGKIQGVDAILYGSVREASALSNGDGLVRLNLMLADVETGKQLWAGAVEGEYAALTPPDPKVQRAALASATAAAEQFAQAKSRLGELDILIFPLVKDRTDFSDLVSAPFVNQGDSKIRFFKDLGLQKGHRKVLNMVKSRCDAGTSTPAILALLQELKDAGLTVDGQDVANPVRKAVLVGQFGALVEDELMTSLPLNLSLVDAKTGQVLWGTNVEKIGVDVRSLAVNKGKPFLAKYGLYILGGLVGLIVLGFFFKTVTRPK